MVIKVKHNGEWVKIPYLSNTQEDGAIQEAPIDGKQYVRKDGFWSVLNIPDQFPEAPIDGKQYVRQDGDWSEIVIPEVEIPELTWEGIANKPTWIGDSKPTYTVDEITNAVATDDSRLSDAREPLAHTHSNYINAIDFHYHPKQMSITTWKGGVQNVDQLWPANNETAGVMSSADKIRLDKTVLNDDERLTDARTPLAHTHGIADTENFDDADFVTSVIFAEGTTVTQAEYDRLLNIAKNGKSFNDGIWTNKITVFNAELIEHFAYYCTIVSDGETIQIALLTCIGGYQNQNTIVIISNDLTKEKQVVGSLVLGGNKNLQLMALDPEDGNPVALELLKTGNGSKVLADNGEYVELPTLDNVATLDESGKVPASQLPSYVDDVLEYDSKTAFPATGESGKIYVDKDTNLTYRWSGSTYVAISSDIALGETESTAYRGDRGKIAYDHSQTTHAPADAQKNSDITLDEINAKLTGNITAHTHKQINGYAPLRTATIDRTATKWEYTVMDTDGVGVTATIGSPTSDKAGILTYTDKQKIDKIVTNGDGGKVLTDSGEYVKISTSLDDVDFSPLFVALTPDETITEDDINIIYNYLERYGVEAGENNDYWMLVLQTLNSITVASTVSEAKLNNLHLIAPKRENIATENNPVIDVSFSMYPYGDNGQPGNPYYHYDYVFSISLTNYALKQGNLLASAIFPGDDGFSVMSGQLVSGEMKTSQITFTTAGDGTKALMDDGSYKEVSGGSGTYVIDWLENFVGNDNTDTVITQAQYDAVKQAILDGKNIAIKIYGGIGFIYFTTALMYGDYPIMNAAVDQINGDISQHRSIYNAVIEPKGDDPWVFKWRVLEVDNLVTGDYARPHQTVITVPNKVTTLSNLPTDAYSIKAVVSGNTAISFANTPYEGSEYMIDILSSTAFTQAIPNAAPWQSDEASINVEANKVTSISIRYIHGKYVVRV